MQTGVPPCGSLAWQVCWQTTAKMGLELTLMLFKISGSTVVNVSCWVTVPTGLSTGCIWEELEPSIESLLNLCSCNWKCLPQGLWTLQTTRRLCLVTIGPFHYFCRRSQEFLLPGPCAIKTVDCSWGGCPVAGPLKIYSLTDGLLLGAPSL